MWFIFKFALKRAQVLSCNFAKSDIWMMMTEDQLIECFPKIKIDNFADMIYAVKTRKKYTKSSNVIVVNKHDLYPTIAKLTLKIPHSEEERIMEYIRFAEKFAEGVNDIELGAEIMTICKSSSHIKHKYVILDSLISKYINL